MDNFKKAAANARGTLFYAAADAAGELESRIYGIVHILVWAIGLILSAVVAFAAHGTLAPAQRHGARPRELLSLDVGDGRRRRLGLCDDAARRARHARFVGGCVLKDEIARCRGSST